MGTTVAIIGNGFDLSLGLKTSYRDFLESEYFPDCSDLTSLADYIKKQAQLNNWIDVEQALADYSKNNHERDTFKEEYLELKCKLSEYISSLPAPCINNQSHALNLAKKLSQLPDFYIVNFNYTDSLCQLLIEFGLDKKYANDRIWHVHGKCSENNIIFGVDDSERISSNHVFLYKSSAHNFTGRGLFQKLVSASEIHFFGHSLGAPDHMYFKQFFLQLSALYSESKLVFHHYGETGSQEIHRQLHVLTGSSVSTIKSNAVVDFKNVLTPACA